MLMDLLTCGLRSRWTMPLANRAFIAPAEKRKENYKSKGPVMGLWFNLPNWTKNNRMVSSLKVPFAAK